MRTCVLWSCALALMACASCRGAAWTTHTDPLGFRIDAPAGWQVSGDGKTGRVSVAGPEGQRVVVWPVFISGGFNARTAPAILRRLTAAAGVTADWRMADAPWPNSVRMAGVTGDRTAVSSLAWFGSASGTAAFLYVAVAPMGAYRNEQARLGRILESFRATGVAPDAKAAGAAEVKW